MRTHVELDEAVMTQVMEMGHFASKKAAINTALADLARSLKRRELLALRGKVAWSGDLDALRAGRLGADAPDLAGA